MTDRIHIPGTKDDFAYASIDDAKQEYIAATGETPNATDEVSLNIYQTPSGKLYYELTAYNYGTNCLWESLDSASDWYWLNWRQYVTEPEPDDYDAYTDCYLVSMMNVYPLDEEECWKCDDQLSAERAFRAKNPHLFKED